MAKEFKKLTTTNHHNWSKLWQKIGAKTEPMFVYEQLAKKYLEPHRHYHNLEHIAHCLSELNSSPFKSDQPEAVELAIWFHDVIYEPRAKNNEEESAKFAQTILKEAGLDEGLINNVVKLILATKHDGIPEELDDQLIVDIDLSGLGQEPALFEKDGQNIRAEYDWISLEDFQQGRAQILKKFLSRPTIYLTPYFKEKYEKRARKNLSRAIAKLK